MLHPPQVSMTLAEAGGTHFGTALRYSEYPMVFLPKLICFCRVSSRLGSVSFALGGLVRSPAPSWWCFRFSCRHSREVLDATHICCQPYLSAQSRGRIHPPGESTTNAAEVSVAIDIFYERCISYMRMLQGLQKLSRCES